MVCPPCARSHGVYKLIYVLSARLKNLIYVCQRVSFMSEDTEAGIGREFGGNRG